MQPVVIVDTSALVALVVASDLNHAQAVAISQQLAQAHAGLVIPMAVMTETFVVLNAEVGRTAALAVERKLTTASTIYIEPVAKMTTAQALERFRHQPPSVSYTDSTVMAVADAWETKAIFGFGTGFGQNGYTLPNLANDSDRLL